MIQGKNKAKKTKGIQEMEQFQGRTKLQQATVKFQEKGQSSERRQREFKK